LGACVTKALNSCQVLGNSVNRSHATSTGSVANDPQETLDVHCGNGFDAGFSPYQSTRLSR
jgi:hypothetical protein